MQSAAEPIQELAPPTPELIVAQKALLVKMLSDAAVFPKNNTIYSAVYDLSSAVDAVVPSKFKAIIPTDIAVSIPDGTYGIIAPRSGLAAK